MVPVASMAAQAEPAAQIALSVNNIEVIYDHVILVLRGVSLQVPKGRIVALLGANGAGKTTTLKAISNLLSAERGDVTKGTIEFEGERVDKLTPNELVRRGVCQVMEGRHCFAHLTVEENLLTGAFTRKAPRAEIRAALEKVYHYFPRLKQRRGSVAGYTSGGEQQMTAVGRALMARPSLILLDEPSMGLAPQIVEEIFEIVGDLNKKENVSFLLAEQNTNVALRFADYGYILENGRVVMDGAAGRAGAERGRQGVLPRSFHGRTKKLSRGQALSPPQALAGLNEHFDTLETRDPELRERAQLAALREPDRLCPSHAPWFGRTLSGDRPGGHRFAGSACQRFRSCANPSSWSCRRRDRPFGGFAATGWGSGAGARGRSSHPRARSTSPKGMVPTTGGSRARSTPRAFVPAIWRTTVFRTTSAPPARCSTPASTRWDARCFPAEPDRPSNRCRRWRSSSPTAMWARRRS